MKPNPQTAFRRERWVKTIAILSLLALGLLILIKVENMLVSFILAFVINYLLQPFVNYLERANLPRSLAILIPFVVTGALIALGIFLLVPLVSEQAYTIQNEVPKYHQTITHLIDVTQLKFNKWFGNFYPIDLSNSAEGFLKSYAGSLVVDLPKIVSKSLTVLMLAPIFAFFMLQDGRKLTRLMLSMVPNPLFELALNLQYQINQQMGGFIRARLLESAIVGAVVFVGLQIIGFPYVVLMSIFAGLTNLIPYIGPVIGAAPALFIAFTNGASGLTLTLVTAIYMAAQIIDLVFVIPLVVAKIVNLHPVSVIIVIIIGSEVMGVLGMVISIPVASAIKLTTVTFYKHLTAFRD